MLLTFNFPFLDIRPFLGFNTHRLSVCDYLDLSVIGDHEFIRSYGEIRQIENSFQGQSSSMYCTANRAVKLSPNNAIDFGSLGKIKKYIPECTFKRFFTNGINCRVDIGIENAFKTLYTNNEIDEIIYKLFYSRLNVPQKPSSKLASYYEINMQHLGKRLAALFLIATTREPKSNHPYIKNNWVLHGNPMVLVEIRKEELHKRFNIENYTELSIPELKEWNVRLLYVNNTKLFDRFSIPCWIIIEDECSPLDKIQNLRVYLLKLHQKRECFKQVLKHFIRDIRNETFSDNPLLSSYVEEYIYKCLLKKRWYGLPNDVVMDVVDKADLTINHQDIQNLLDYFSTRKLKYIEERRDKNMGKNSVQIGDGNTFFGSQFGSDNEQKIDIGGSVIIGSMQNSTFANEAAEAIVRINGLPELQQAQKDFLVSIIKDAQNANERNDENEIKSCKDKFKSFLAGAGNIADKVLSTLANLATIVAFFGFGK